MEFSAWDGDEVSSLLNAGVYNGNCVVCYVGKPTRIVVFPHEVVLVNCNHMCWSVSSQSIKVCMYGQLEEVKITKL